MPNFDVFLPEDVERRKLAAMANTVPPCLLPSPLKSPAAAREAASALAAPVASYANYPHFETE